MMFPSACKQEKRYRTDTGLMYLHYPSDSNDSIARMGTTVKLRIVQKVRDSVIDNNYDKMPLYWMVMPGYGNRYNPLEVFDYGMKEGDSIVTMQLVDSMQRKGIFDSIPSWMKKDDLWYSYIKVEKVFRSDSALQADRTAEANIVTEKQTALGKTRIEQYLKQHQINATPGIHASFKEMLQEGNGGTIEKGDSAKIDFRVKSLRGKLLNASSDSSYNPVTVVMGTDFFPEVIQSQLTGIARGSIVRIYVPGVLIFGIQPNSKDIKLGDDIIFELGIDQPLQ